KLPGTPEYRKEKSGDQSHGSGNGKGDMFVVYWSETPSQDPAVVASYAETVVQTWTGQVVNKTRTDVKLDSHAGIEQRLELKGGSVEFDQAAPGRPVVFVRLETDQATDAHVKLLAAFPKLRKLFLSGATITDAGLQHLGALTELQELYLGGAKISDAGLRHLA